MMNTAALRQKLIHIAWPIIIAQTAVMANGMIDTLMAGRLSAEDIAAVGIGSGIYAVVFVSFMGILLGLTPIIAHHEGAGRTLQIGHDVRQSFWLALLLIVLGMLVLRFPTPFLQLAQPPPLVAEKVRAYLATIMWGLPALLLFRVFYGFTSGIGHTRPMMLFNLTGLMIKVPLNFVFMYGAGGIFAPQGAVGAATATAVAGFIVCLIAWIAAINGQHYAPYRVFSHFEWPNWRAQWTYLRLGLPIGFSLFIDVSSFAFMALFIAHLGATASAAHQIAASIAVAFFMMPAAVGQATSVLLGQRLGAGERAQARVVAKMGLTMGMGLSLALSSVLLILAPLLAPFFTSEPNVQTMATGLIRVVAFYHLADALQMIAVQILRGYKLTLLPSIIYTFALWGIGLGGGYVLALTDMIIPAMGVAGFWWAAALGLILSGLIFVGYWRKISQ